MLGAHAINNEIKKADEKSRLMRERFSQLMSTTQA